VQQFHDFFCRPNAFSRQRIERLCARWLRRRTTYAWGKPNADREDDDCNSRCASHGSLLDLGCSAARRLIQGLALVCFNLLEGGVIEQNLAALRTCINSDTWHSVGSTRTRALDRPDDAPNSSAAARGAYRNLTSHRSTIHVLRFADTKM
jgi:hypothetical protein